MKDPTELLWRLMSEVEYFKYGEGKRQWRFRKDIKFVRNPDILCPNCKKSFPSNRHWLLDVNRVRIKAIWHLDGRAVTEEEIWHPHRCSSGSICMGDSKDFLDMLFLNVAKGEHYYPTDSWMWNMGHRDCANMVMVDCEHCQARVPHTNRHTYAAHILCSFECWLAVGEIRCETCYRERPKVEGHGKFCQTCFENEANACASCESLHLAEDMKRFSDDTKICDACLEKLTICDDCKKEISYKDLDSSKHCNDCKEVECRGCYDWYPRYDLDEDRRCENCNNPRYYCWECDEEVEDEGDLCEGCQCRNCHQKKQDDSDYCRDCQPYYCSCPHCEGCDNEVDEEYETCSACEDNCREEFDCACNECNCLAVVYEDGEVCYDCSTGSNHNSDEEESDEPTESDESDAPPVLGV